MLTGFFVTQENMIKTPEDLIDKPTRHSRFALGVFLALLFAALGISSQGANADAASRWILQADEPAVYATLEEASAAGETMQAWAAPVQQPAAAPTHFTSRPINAWSRAAAPASTASAQLETAAYRFER